MSKDRGILKKFKILDLFCGAGGAAVGYNRAGFEVVGVDNKLQPHYPYEFHEGDALEFVLEHGKEFDVIHASPPCQRYTGMRNITLSRYGSVPNHPDLIPVTRSTLDLVGKPYVIENVVRSPLKTQIILCGAALGLCNLSRHRCFESNILLFGLKCQCRGKKIVSVYGLRADGRRVTYRKYYKGQGVAKSLEEGSSAMGIDWMDWLELTQAIPPVYTEYVGKQLLIYLKRGSVECVSAKA